MSFCTLFDIPFGIPNVYVLAPEKPLTASPRTQLLFPSVSDRWFPRREGSRNNILCWCFQPPLGEMEGNAKRRLFVTLYSHEACYFFTAFMTQRVTVLQFTVLF